MMDFFRVTMCVCRFVSLNLRSKALNVGSKVLNADSKALNIGCDYMWCGAWLCAMVNVAMRDVKYDYAKCVT